VLVLAIGLSTFTFDGAATAERSIARRTLHQFEREVLPEFLSPRGWFKSKTPAAVRLRTRTLWETAAGTFLLAFIEVEDAQGTREQYSLPLALVWEDSADSGVLRTVDWTLAKIREHARVGVLIDAFADPRFCIEVVRTVATGAELPMTGGTLRFESTDQLRELIQHSLEPVEHFGGEQTRTRVVLGERIFLKAYRGLIPGPNPDLEMTRFLTDAGYRHIGALVGAVRWEAPDSLPVLLVSLFQHVGNQGHVWSYVLSHLNRHASNLFAEQHVREQDPHALINAQMRTLGRRVGELHATLARQSNDPAFAPEPMTDADLAELYRGVSMLANDTLQRLSERLGKLPEAVQDSARELIAHRDRLFDIVRRCCVHLPGAIRTRVHGNLHLKKILLVADDFLITDFDGDMNRTPADRRAKTSPLHDVATLLRSFDYARATALERAVTARPDLYDRAAPAFAEWQRGVTQALLRGYRQGLEGAHTALAAESSERLLNLLQIERALHELNHELTPLSAGLHIPIDALRAMLAT
jgi:maltose alpha-D-glucosyltransferase / alpha-amylase